MGDYIVFPFYAAAVRFEPLFANFCVAMNNSYCRLAILRGASIS